MSDAEEILDSDQEDACITKACKEWVGKRKAWPKSDVPTGLVLFCRRQLSVPEDVASSLFPKSYEKVNKLLASKLPDTSHDIAFTKPNLWFSQQPPNCDTITILNSRPLPPQQALQGLRAALGQALLASSQSLADPKFSDTRLPIYVITCWEEMYHLKEMKALLAKCDLWLRSNKAPTASLAMVNEAHRRFLSMAWNASLDLPGAPSEATHLFLAQLLGEGKVTTGMVDSMAKVARRILQNRNSLY